MVGVGTPAAASLRPACEVSATASVRAERRTPRIAVVSPHKYGALDRFSVGLLVRRSAPMGIVPLYAGRLRV